MLALAPADLAAGLAAGGAPADLAAQQAEHVDQKMADCILALYRSAVTVGDEWEARWQPCRARPALVLWGANDPYVGPEFGVRLAARIEGELDRVRRLLPLVAVGARAARRRRHSSSSGAPPARPPPAPAARAAYLAAASDAICPFGDLRENFGSGGSQAVIPARPPSSGHSPANTPQVHSKPGTVQSCSIQMSLSGDLATTGGGALRLGHRLGADDHATLHAQPAIEVVLVPPVVRPGEALRRATRVEHEVAEPDDLGVGVRAVVEQLGRRRGVEAGRRAWCSCSARRCRARTASTCGTRPLRPARPSGTSPRRRGRSSARPAAPRRPRRG